MGLPRRVDPELQYVEEKTVGLGVRRRIGADLREGVVASVVYKRPRRHNEISLLLRAQKRERAYG